MGQVYGWIQGVYGRTKGVYSGKFMPACGGQAEEEVWAGGNRLTGFGKLFLNTVNLALEAFKVKLEGAASRGWGKLILIGSTTSLHGVWAIIGIPTPATGSMGQW